MKIVENTNIANLSPLASAIYDKLAHNQQMLFLTWECEDDELTNQVAHFLNHFDAAIAHSATDGLSFNGSPCNQ